MLEDYRIQTIIQIDKPCNVKITSFTEARYRYVYIIPTFIFLRAGKEMGRIVERPRGSIEGDIIDFLK